MQSLVWLVQDYRYFSWSTMHIFLLMNNLKNKKIKKTATVSSYNVNQQMVSFSSLGCVLCVDAEHWNIVPLRLVRSQLARFSGISGNVW